MAILILLSSIVCLVFSVTNIINWNLDSKKTNKKINIIKDTVKIKEVEDSKNVEIIKNDELEKSNPYWEYINTKMIDVDLEKLKKINKDTKGWIQVLGTNVNYPFVQTKNNKFYLNHSFDKTYNKAGWVFSDYRNNGLDRNNIFYAHGRLDGTMFGSLRDALKNKWFKNINNHLVKISTAKENTLWQIFSVYNILETDDYLKINFSDDKYKSFLNTITKRSKHAFNTSVSINDKILSLSTCYKSNQRIVLHAKLIKRDAK